MKRITAIIFAVLFCLAIPVISYADDIYIVDDGEDVFIPDNQTTTTKPPETTTASSVSGDTGSLGEYLDGFSNMLGNGIDSILSGLEDNFGDFQFGETTTAADANAQLKPIDPGKPPVTVESAITTQKSEQQSEKQETTTETQADEEELPSVLIVNQADDSDDSISGSTLTLLVFIAAIVIIILVGAIVLVLMTKRTEYNSAVKIKSAIPSVEQPSALAQFMDDDIKDDGKDYGNIAYWDN